MLPCMPHSPSARLPACRPPHLPIRARACSPAAAARWAAAEQRLSQLSALLGAAIFLLSWRYLSHFTETTGQVRTAGDGCRQWLGAGQQQLRTGTCRGCAGSLQPRPATLRARVSPLAYALRTAPPPPQVELRQAQAALKDTDVTYIRWVGDGVNREGVRW